MSSQEEEVIETEYGVPIETLVHRKVKTEVVTVENNNNPKNIRAQSEYRAFKTSPLPVQPDSNIEFEPQPIQEEEIEDNFQDIESNSDFEEAKEIDFEKNKESYLEENKKVYFEEKDLKGIDPELEFVKELTGAEFVVPFFSHSHSLALKSS